MKAVVYRSYGSLDVLGREEVPRPTPSDEHIPILP
jgi:hypothetical protein